MNTQPTLRWPPVPVPERPPPRGRPLAAGRPIGRHLVEMGLLGTRDLVQALELQRRMDARLGDILLTKGLIAPHDLRRALARQYNLRLADLEAEPPERALAPLLPAALCLQFRVVPWRRIGTLVLVATNRPQDFERLRACMGPLSYVLVPVIADERQIQHQITRLYGGELAHRAATRVPDVHSCRRWENGLGRRSSWAAALLAMLALAMVLAPLWTLTLACLVVFVGLLGTSGLKAAAFVTQLRHRQGAESRAPPAPPFRLPRVAVLVPLLREKEIAAALIARLTRLTYPKSLLDVVLVLEAEDAVTRDTLTRTDLPAWMRVIEVPAAGSLTTKPRAMNYALDFCEGSIIGVWDAEDAPEPDQIEQVVARFAQAPENVACLQGVLDYYNAATNWMSRCFAIEYATWWRVLLPGVARMGLVVPLGGTTLFFRRDVLEKLSRWDAHNVTEDADLGVRLARAGYVTELLPTTTYEEATCRPWPWVRQRSRWLKGFLITWAVHMRHPAQTLRDLGWKRFLGVQALLLGTFVQFAGAPLLWSFWLALLGGPHPVALTLGAPVLWAMVAVFMASEMLNLICALYAVTLTRHRRLKRWCVTMPFYFPLGTWAAMKALREVVRSPFYWDKTQHGQSPGPPLPRQPSPARRSRSPSAPLRASAG